MELFDNIGEQPSMDKVASATDSVGIDNLSFDSSEGSLNLGKFKSVEELIKAYNNLQSEFTKKCQYLNEILKEKSDNVENNTPEKVEFDWQNSVDSFLEKYPQAKEFSKEIADVITSDKDLMSHQNSLEIAYSKVLENDNTRLKKLLKDERFIEKNISENVKQSILKEYLNQVNNYSPFLMNSKGGNNITASYKKPISVFEAGEMAKKIFK